MESTMNTNRIHAATVPFKRCKGALKNRSADFSFFSSTCLYNIIGPDRYIVMLYENFNDMGIDKSHTIYYLFFGHSLNDFDLIFFRVVRFLRAQCHMYNKGDILKVRRTGEVRR